MEVQLTPAMQATLDQMASETGRPHGEIVLDAMAGYFGELLQVRETLDGRYDDIKSGNAALIDGEEFFEDLRRREDELIAKHIR